MLPLAKTEMKLHQDVTVCNICGKSAFKKFARVKNHQKFRDHCYFTGEFKGAAHTISKFRFNVPNEFPVVFHD